VPPDDGVRDVVVGEGKPLLRLRVVRRPPAEGSDLPDLALNLLHDLGVVDDLVLELGLGERLKNRSWPEPEAASAAARAGRRVLRMRSTLTWTSFFCPQFFDHTSVNHLS